MTVVIMVLPPLKVCDLYSVLRASMIRGTVLVPCPGRSNFRCQWAALRVAFQFRCRTSHYRWHVVVEEDGTFTVLEERDRTKGTKHGIEA